MKNISVAAAALLAFSLIARGQAPEGKSHSFDTYGVTIRVPEGGIVSAALPSGVLFDFWSADKTSGSTASIMPVGDVPVDHFAASMAGQFHGTTVAGDDTIDGEKAILVNAAVNMEKCKARCSLIAIHQGRALTVTGFGIDGAAAEQAARKLAGSVSFSDIESPADHTDFNAKNAVGFGVGNAHVMIAGPDWLHMLKASGSQVTFTGYDFTTGQEPFTVIFSFADMPADVPALVLAAHLGSSLKGRLQLTETPTWRALSTDTHEYMSSVMRPTSGKGVLGTGWKAAVIEPAPGKMLNVVFMINEKDPDREKAYLDLADAMIKRLKIDPPAQASAEPK